MRDSSILPSAKPTSFLYKTDQSAPRATSYVYNQYLHFAVLEIGFGKHCLIPPSPGEKPRPMPKKTIITHRNQKKRRP